MTTAIRKPDWLKRPLPSGGRKDAVERLLHGRSLHTVCVEAKCPNRGECFTAGTATFLILGDICTRGCAFCGITKGVPQPLDREEPLRVAAAIREMAVAHAVITSVTRDDLADGGAGVFAAVVAAVRSTSPNVTIELLTPDFAGDRTSLEMVLASGPDVFNHNIETVPRLYHRIRPQAKYERSLGVLRAAAESKRAGAVKSGLMVGLGETPDEVVAVLRDLYDSGCTMVTIGQYLQPSAHQTAVESFIEPAQFKAYEQAGLDLGLKQVFSGPFVRSSYHAGELLLSRAASLIPV